jgi:hypothetical protein
MKDFKLEWLDSDSKKTKRCTYQEFYDALAAFLNTKYYMSKIDKEQYSILDRFEYFSIHESGLENKMLPEYRWIYAWPTVGGSEAFYFHIELYTPSAHKSDCIPLFLAKAFCEDIDEVLIINSAINEFILKNAYGSY